MFTARSVTQNAQLHSQQILRPSFAAPGWEWVSAIRKIAVAISFTLCLTLVVTGIGVSSTESQIQSYFQLSAYIGAVPDQVRQAILKKLPIGSPEAEIRSFLLHRGIGTDANTFCVEGNHHTSLTCRIGIRPSFWQLVRQNYTLSFQAFENDGRDLNLNPPPDQRLEAQSRTRQAIITLVGHGLKRCNAMVRLSALLKRRSTLVLPQNRESCSVRLVVRQENLATFVDYLQCTFNRCRSRFLCFARVVVTTAAD